MLADNLEPCSSREDFGWTDDKKNPIYLCKNINKELGWRHAVDHQCCKMCTGHDTQRSVIHSVLKFALRDWKNDQELYEDTYKGNRSHVVRKAIEAGISYEDIVINLVRGIARGVPESEVMAIAQEFNLLEEE